MKALFALALVGAASAAMPANINAKYFNWKNASTACSVATGYSVRQFTDGATWAALTTPLVPQLSATVTVTDVNTVAEGSACAFASAATITQIACADGYVSNNAAEQGVYALQATAGTWGASANAPGSVPAGVVQGDLSMELAFTCIRNNLCNATCTGTTCAFTSQQYDIGATITPCTGGTVSTAATTLNGAATTPAWTYTCTNNGDVYAFVCTNTFADVPEALRAQWYALNYGAWTSGANCNCVAGSTVTYTCASGDVSCPAQTGCAASCTAVGTTRQNTLRNNALCASGLTLAQTIECFRQANCVGITEPALDTCQINQGLNPVTLAVNQPMNLDACPYCNDSSKKGLLGLLGLLGLIPLLLCSLLCCLLLLSIRRKKSEGDVHFATFDAGAAPVCEPVAEQYQTVHTATHIGAPHMGAPMAMGPAVY